MMRLIQTFFRNQRGVAGIEFAFVAPIVIGLLVMAVDGWQREVQLSDMRTAMHTGARYYETGGSDDTVAQTVSTASWSTKPANGAVSIVRACMCGSSAVSCTTVCSNSNLPSVFVTLAATGTYSGLMQSHVLSQNDVIRVR